MYAQYGNKSKLSAITCLAKESGLARRDVAEVTNGQYLDFYYGHHVRFLKYYEQLLSYFHLPSLYVHFDHTCSPLLHLLSRVNSCETSKPNRFRYSPLI